MTLGTPQNAIDGIRVEAVTTEQRQDASGVQIGHQNESVAELLRPLAQKVSAIERKMKAEKLPTQKEIIRQQMIEFSCPRRCKEPKDSWPKIWEDYLAKYPKEKRGKRDSYEMIRLAHNRYCPTHKKAKP